MKLKIAYYGNPILRKKCDPITNVNDEIRQLIKDMFETMQIENGIGLAAPQVHFSLRLFVTCVPKQQEDESWDSGIPRVFINPKILSYSDISDFRGEGCLSVPGIYGDIERPITVEVEAMDENGKLFRESFEDLEARCILHENDHINGKLFLDRMDKKERKLIEPELILLKKKLEKMKK